MNYLLRAIFYTCCSVAQLCLTLYDPMNCSTQGFPVLHHLLKLAQTHVHWVIDFIQPSPPLLLLPSVFPSIRVFSNESVPKCRSFNISPSNEYSGLISFRVDWFDLFAIQGTLKSLLQHYSAPQNITERKKLRPKLMEIFHMFMDQNI